MESLEFAGYDYADEDVEFFLTETDEDTRNNKVQEIREDNPKAFSKSTAGQRMGQGAIMFLTMLFKCIVIYLNSCDTAAISDIYGNPGPFSSGHIINGSDAWL